MALANLVAHGDELEGLDRKSILKKAATGEVLVLDVRPSAEFAVAHLPHARSLPVDELREAPGRAAQGHAGGRLLPWPILPDGQDAVALLRKKGYRAMHLTDGVAEWRARGLPIES